MIIYHRIGKGEIMIYMDDLDAIDNILKYLSYASDELAISNAKRKLRDGEELNYEDQEDILLTVNFYARKQLIKYSQSKSGLERIKLKCLYAICLLFGLKNLSIVTEAVSTGLKCEKENYKELIASVDITDVNREPKNFSSLITQYASVCKYSDTLIEIMEEFSKRTGSYKKDYSTPIAHDKLKQLQETREQILSLSKKYIER